MENSRLETLVGMVGKEVFTTAEAAIYLGVTYDTMKRTALAHKVTYYQQGKAKYFRRRDLEAYMTRGLRFTANEELEQDAATRLAVRKR